ncbi:hypothetical protein, partial [Mesorhizobium sp.]|uniref:hypothetical protein n=1 Tax=Mesorhizobium sp. TaxID=1871066 RepID=UPI0025DE1560
MSALSRSVTFLGEAIGGVKSSLRLTKALDPATHIGPADRQPDPHLARDRDHETLSAFTIAAASVGGVVSGIRSPTLP